MKSHRQAVGNPDAHQTENQYAADFQKPDKGSHALNHSVTEQVDQKRRQDQRHAENGHHATTFITTEQLHGVGTKGARKEALGDHHREIHQQGVERRRQPVAIGFVKVHANTPG